MKRKKITILFVVLILICFFVLAVTGNQCIFQTEETTSAQTEGEIIKEDTVLNRRKLLEEASTETNKETAEEGIYSGWKTYINDLYGYQFKYPPEAKVSEAVKEAFCLTSEERDKGLTEDDIYEKYTGKICINISYKLGNISILSPGYKGFVICGRTGMGVCDENTKIKDIQEEIIIEGKTYNAVGNEVIASEDAVDNKLVESKEILLCHYEILHLTLEDGSRIEYGSISDYKATYQEYLDIKETLVRIIESYKKI